MTWSNWSVRIDKEMKRKMKLLKSRVNWSEVIREVVAQKILEEESKSEDRSSHPKTPEIEVTGLDLRPIPYITKRWLTFVQRRVRKLPYDAQIMIARDIHDTVESRIKMEELKCNG